MSAQKCCGNCGFLTKGMDELTDALQVTRLQRSDWRINPKSETAHCGQNLDRPQCYADEPGLGEDIEKIPNDPEIAQRVKEVLEKPRCCDSFRKYLQGYSPKEHHQMVLLEEQRQRDLDWQQKCLEREAAEVERRMKEDREWQELASAKRAQWEADQNAMNRAANWRAMWVTLGAGAFFGIGTGVAIECLKPFVSRDNQPSRVQKANESN